MRMKLSAPLNAEKGNNSNSNPASSSVIIQDNQNSSQSSASVPTVNAPNIVDPMGGLNFAQFGVNAVRSGTTGHDAATDYVIVHNTDSNNNNNGRHVSNEGGDPEMQDLQSRMSMTSLAESSNHSQPLASNVRAQNNGSATTGDFASSPFQPPKHGPLVGGESSPCYPQNGAPRMSPSMCENVRRGFVLKTADAQTKDSFDKLCGVFSQVDALFALTRKFDGKPSPEQLAGIIFSSKSSSSEQYTNFVSYYHSLLHVFPLEEFQDEIVQTYLTEDPSNATHFLKTLFLRIDSRHS